MTIETKENTETPAGDNVATTDEGNAQATEQKAEVTVESLLARIEKVEQEKEAVLKNRDEILGKYKKKQSRVDELESSNLEAQKEKAAEEGNLQKLVEIQKEELSKWKTQAEEFETKEVERKEKMLKDLKVAVFMKELGSELHNAADLNKVNWDKVVQNEDGTFNKEGIAQAVESFRTGYGYAIKGNPEALPQGAAQTVETTDRKKTFGERMKEAGSILGDI